MMHGAKSCCIQSCFVSSPLLRILYLEFSTSVSMHVSLYIPGVSKAKYRAFVPSVNREEDRREEDLGFLMFERRGRDGAGRSDQRRTDKTLKILCVRTIIIIAQSAAWCKERTF
ncbi:uncharacterized protein LOC105201125 isoform X2 [Solenopsis invicta]|uniref:uncharacterized protein LOC105201125 isoform X2 n=1 Tax=Solenopsis invicta TaxID=13686 RepID=UPI0005962215|nr:uncharacterized protein LOC105201125 isoform X2 [Solenopsis invicta]